MRGSGERLHGMQEVTGSIPVFSTRTESTAQQCVVLFLLQTCAKKKRLPWPERAAANAFGVYRYFQNSVWQNSLSALCDPTPLHQKAGSLQLLSCAPRRILKS